jgi:hypothetical protein
MQTYISDIDNNNNLEELSNQLVCEKYSKKKLQKFTGFFLYVDFNSNIKHITSTEFNLSIPNTLLKRELREIIKQHSYNNNKNYKLTYLLKYNFNIDEKNIKHMKNYNFLYCIDSLDNIYFKSCIEVMEDINSLFFILVEKHRFDKRTRKNFLMGSSKKTIKTY